MLVQKKKSTGRKNVKQKDVQGIKIIVHSSQNKTHLARTLLQNGKHSGEKWRTSQEQSVTVSEGPSNLLSSPDNCVFKDSCKTTNGAAAVFQFTVVSDIGALKSDIADIKDEFKLLRSEVNVFIMHERRTSESELDTCLLYISLKLLLRSY